MATITKHPTEWIESRSTSKGTIPNNMLAPIMRRSMENKNLLGQKGSIYVGSGRVNKTTVVSGSDTVEYETVETTSLNPPSYQTTDDLTNYEILVIERETAEGTSKGGVKNLAWKRLLPAKSTTFTQAQNTQVLVRDDTAPTGLGWNYMPMLGAVVQVAQSNWTGSSAPYILSITQAKHGLPTGTQLIIKTQFQQSGTNVYMDGDVSVDNSGNITIKSNVKLSGKVLIVGFNGLPEITL